MLGKEVMLYEVRRLGCRFLGASGTAKNVRISAAGSKGQEFRSLVPAVPLTFTVTCQQSFHPGQASGKVPNTRASEYVCHGII